MASLSAKKYVAAPPPRAFAWACDFARAAERIRSIRCIELLTPDPVGLGTRFRQTRLTFGQEATEELEVTAFDPPRGYRLSCENHGCRFESDLSFTPSGEGTEVEMRVQVTPLTAAAKLMAAMLSPLIDQAAEEFSKDLDDLKTAIESAGS